MSARALRRRLERAAALHMGAGVLGPAGSVAPRDWIVEEQDRRREQLAEQVLLSLTDDLDYDSRSADLTPQLTVLAKAAVAAATVVYPEPEEENPEKGGA